MSKIDTRRKTLFNVMGEIITLETGKMGFRPYSPAHLQKMYQWVGRGPTVLNFERKVPTRSDQQLAYHWVLMGYLAEHTGYTREEMHDAVMRLKFGTKVVELAGVKVHVRPSIAERARFSKIKMVELIEYDLELCAKMEIKVPTKEELGYLPS